MVQMSFQCMHIFNCIDRLLTFYNCIIIATSAFSTNLFCYIYAIYCSTSITFVNSLREKKGLNMFVCVIFINLSWN